MQTKRKDYSFGSVVEVVVLTEIYYGKYRVRADLVQKFSSKFANYKVAPKKRDFWAFFFKFLNI